MDATTPRSRLGTKKLLALILSTIGPGLIVMLADTDAGSLITAAQSGAQWGYNLLPLQLALIPVLFIVQELTLRLGIVTKLGHGELIRAHFGPFWAWFSCSTLVIACLGALITELSGLAGVGSLFGISPLITMIIVVTSLSFIIWSHSYQSVERMAVILGLFELAFFYIAYKSNPDWSNLYKNIELSTFHDHKFLYLITANIGAVIMPWMIFFQQSAIVEKKLTLQHVKIERWETAIGAVITQIVMAAVLIAAASTLFTKGLQNSLDSVQDISNTLIPFLGQSAGKIVFAMGMAGAALVATIVVSLTAAWGVGEVAGYRRSLADKPTEAPWFYGILTTCLILSGVLVASEAINLVKLSIAIEFLNAILLPFVLGFLFILARRSLPETYRLKGIYSLVVAFIMGGTAILGLIAGIFAIIEQ
jgi:NRAMP (natural resistance-associated macrophage protein)-like metal ion transporter